MGEKKKITQAFILGAGLGTRLRPLTDTMPKVMVPIAPGKPLLEHTIEWLRDQGITDFVINLHYLPEAITGYFGDGKKWGVHIAYSDETGTLLETAGALKKAEPLLDDEFLFLYGDELQFLNILPLIGQHTRHGKALGTVTLKKSDIPQNGDVAEFDPASREILKWHTRPHAIGTLGDTRLLNAGIYVLSKKILTYIPEGVPVKLDGEVIPKAFAAGEIFLAFPVDEPIIDIGTLEKYELAKEYYRKHGTKRKEGRR